MRGMKKARGTDPSAGVRDKKPKPRHARWSEGEAVRLVKAAWRHGYLGLSCIIAVARDTQFSPIDVRTLAASTAPWKATVSYLIGRKRVGLRLGFRQAVRSRDERNAWSQPIRRNLAPNFTRMRFCSTIGPRPHIGKAHWPTISRPCARSSSPVAASWTCADQERLRPLWAVPILPP
jgi:hypothetical protein